jgi:hypothetical protein
MLVEESAAEPDPAELGEQVPTPVRTIVLYVLVRRMRRAR